MRLGAGLGCLLAMIAGGAGLVLPAQALAGNCPGNPDALGVSRTLVVDPAQYARVGTMQYSKTLALEDREVVLTFDDGPLPPYTNAILDTLAAECVKATYFIVGRMARAYPAAIRRVAAEGHTIGTHSQNHPFTFHTMTEAMAQREIEQGIASTATALDGATKVAPFFRIPGLLRANPVEHYLASRGIATWSADFPADDWMRKVNDKEIVRRALARLEAKGKGILLLHDIHPATVMALPNLLRALKTRGYRIVHVVPSMAAQAKGEPELWAFNPGRAQDWPKPARLKTRPVSDLPAPSLASFDPAIPLSSGQSQERRGKAAKRAASAVVAWPSPAGMIRPDSADTLPAPDIENLSLPRMPRNSAVTLALRPALAPDDGEAIRSPAQPQPGRWPVAATALAD
jgi:peptidoglycan/xylan/chitin deacetylase (PgdA/CDA1 family)